MYLFKDDFKLGPATLIFALGLVRIPMNVKLLFAIISDGIPIFGSTRRSYLFIGALLTFTATLILGMFAHLSVWLTGGLLGLFSAGMAICSVIGEALIIETGHTKSNEQVTRTISAFSAFRKVTFAAMSYISSILVTRIPKQVWTCNIPIAAAYFSNGIGASFARLIGHSHGCRIIEAPDQCNKAMA
ncbi:Biopterin transporter family [Babesia duncani]|uniref:Biopterin transporter family n=1 Tax=Babesia duncani TaxID=323732 RepID=A0AAD9PKV0_9APIC|nr:Biopterin transporter family [Babesia duncani]